MNPKTNHFIEENENIYLNRKQNFENEDNKKNTKKVKFIDLVCNESINDIFEQKSDNCFHKNKKSKIIALPPLYHCVECFSYLGDTNPRQFCCKYYCPYQDFNENDILQMKVYNLRYSPYYDNPNFFGYNKYHNIIQEFIDKNYIENINDNYN